MQKLERTDADDDGPVLMTMNERTVWAYLVVVVLTSGAYITLMVSRLLSQPAEEISWIVPMLWTIGASVVGSILFAIVGAVVGAVRVAQAAKGHPAREDLDLAYSSDVRDAEIDRRGGRASLGVLGASMVGALVLAMLDADTFWIGNLLFVFGTAGALVETTTKIRLYRRGF